MRPTPQAEKDAIKKKLAEDIKAYLSKGGDIKQIERGKMAEGHNYQFRKFTISGDQ